MPGPPMVSGGIGDFGSCLMSVDAASSRVKELETDGVGGSGGGGTDGKTGGTAVLPFSELYNHKQNDAWLEDTRTLK